MPPKYPVGTRVRTKIDAKIKPLKGTVEALCSDGRYNVRIDGPSKMLLGFYIWEIEEIG